MTMQTATNEYRRIVSNLKDRFAKGVIAEADFYDMCDMMRKYLDRYPHMEERLVWQSCVNAEIGYPRDYDFDFEGKGPSHIRWGFTFVGSPHTGIGGLIHRAGEHS